MPFNQTIHRLWRGTATVLPPGARLSATTGQRREYEDIKNVNIALLPLLALGFAAAGWLGWTANAMAPVLLWCMACLAVGATVGFLFGIPRSSKDVVKQNGNKSPSLGGRGDSTWDGRWEGGRPNTNLEEVSDWLTKIIVGLTLVNLGTIESRVVAISRKAAESLRADPTNADVSAATALVVGFAVLGFQAEKDRGIQPESERDQLVEEILAS